MNHRLSAILATTLIVTLAAVLDGHAQSFTFDAGTAEGGSFSGRIIQGILLIGILSVAPGIVIMCTSFTRIVVVLSLVRTGLGLQNSPPNMVMTSLALFLTFFIMQPHLEQAWNEGLRPLIDDEISEEAAMENMVAPFRTFMEANVREKDLALFESLAAGNTEGFQGGTQQEPQTEVTTSPDQEAELARPSLRVLVPAFMISELKRAFEIGFLLMIPFLVIDLVISAILMSMGMMMLPPVMISLPFKIVFFVLVDGWYLIAGSLARSYV